MVLEKGTLHIMISDIPKNWLKFSGAHVVAKHRAAFLLSSSLQILLGFANTKSALIAEYLPNYFQSKTIWPAFCSYIEFLIGFAQGSILWIILLNHFINDLIFCTMKTEVRNFADAYHRLL